MSGTAYDEVLDFITSTPTLEQIINFEHSPKTVERVNYLLQCVDDETITDAEREELRELSNHLENVREEERTHIAREIHDELGQQLTILKMAVLSGIFNSFTPDEK